MRSSAHRVVAPYSRFAAAYDQTLGIPAFARFRTAFEQLVRRFDIRFRSAADLGCGTGLFARYLNRCWGVPVFAVDLSPDMLNAAARNCIGSSVRLLRQDIRSLCLPNPVDLVTANFDTVNHLTGDFDLPLALRRVNENLNPGGHVIFDFVTPCSPLGGPRKFLRLFRSVGREVLQHIRWDGRHLSSRLVFRSPHTRMSTVEVHRERAYSPSEVGRALLDAGFTIRGVVDFASLRTAAGCPPRVIVIAMKCRRRSFATFA